MTELKIGTKVECLNSDGAVFMLGTVVAISASQYAMQIDDRHGHIWLVSKSTMQDTDGDQWRAAVKRESRFYNIYLDGPHGNTGHRTIEAATAATKYHRIRVAIMEKQYEDGTLVNVVTHPTEPQLRSAGVPQHNPFAKAA